MAQDATVGDPKRKGGTPKGKPKPRSPSYPAVTIKEAIGLAEKVFEKERRNEVAPDVLFGHWKYRPKSGSGIVAVAAMKAYGLLDTVKASGKLKLSELALQILLDRREDATERKQAIRTAALKPAMHKVMWEEYGAELPSDPNLLYFLEREREFTPSGAAQFIAQYKATLEFARLEEDDSISGGEGDNSQSEEPPMNMLQPPVADSAAGRRLPPPTPHQPPSGAQREIPIPISGSAWPSLKASFPMTEAAWTQMLAVLTAMKPGLVLKEEQEAEPQS